MIELNNLIEDVPTGGPLAIYRKKASFNWKKLKLFLEDSELIEFRNKIWRTLRKDPDFHVTIDDLPINELKKQTFKRVQKLKEYDFLPENEMLSNPIKELIFDEAIIMLDNDCNVKFSLNNQMFKELMRNMGSERHVNLIEQCEKGEIFGCFALTEISHGSNTKQVKTTAHYDPKTEQFVINTPSLEDSKVWVGNMGKTATHSAVYAQLYTPDGQCHGLHIFIVPIRDPYTMLLMPGVVCGDMGPKAGLNGVDNGFATFNKVRIPRENMLNKTGDVTPEGKYVSPIKDAKKRFGISLGALSNGRVGLTHYAPCIQSLALSIAVRYGVVRQQFGPENGQEQSILDYQSHQYRLMPLLALCYVWRVFSLSFFENLSEFLFGLATGDKSDRQADLGKEIHAISCASKPISSWSTQGVIQECREACGGHGYLKAARLTDLRNSNDPLLTFEGDNNVLLQQTSNFLLSNFEEYLKTKKIADSPLGIAGFLNNFETNISLKFNCQDRQELLSQKVVMEMFDWLICYVTKISYEKLKSNLDKGLDLFTARNENQIFFSKTLATIFMERQLIERFITKINENKDESLQKILNKILYLSAFYLLDKHVGIFYQGSYFSSEKPVFMIREAILELCRQMKNEAVAMVDAIAPPDYVLNSVLGNSDGLVYENLYNAMIQSNGAFEPIKIPKSKL